MQTRRRVAGGRTPGAARANYSCWVSILAAPDAFVIRGGIFARPEDLLTAVEDSYEDGDGAVASVFVGSPLEGESLDDAIARVANVARLPHSKIRVATVESLVACGFTVEQDTSDGQPDCHHNVGFTEPPDMAQARLFVDCFDEPIANPAKD